MLTDYVNAALRHATYEQLPDGEGYYGAISELPGVWGNADTLEEAREAVRVSLEGWVALALERHVPIPEIDGVTLSFQAV
jgi:predicted RNase H-like HicB family nuclease